MIRGEAISVVAAGLFSGTERTWITPCRGPVGGSSSYGLAVFANSVSPQVGPAPSGYDELYTIRRGFAASSANPVHAVMVCAPQSAYCMSTGVIVWNGFAGSSLIVKTRTPSQPVGVPPGTRGAPQFGLAIVVSTASSSRSGTPLPLRSHRMGSFCAPSHAKSRTRLGLAGSEMLKIRTPPRGPVPGGNPAPPV